MVVAGLEALPKAGAQMAIVDSAANPEQPIGTALRGNDNETNHRMKFKLGGQRRISRGHAESGDGSPSSRDYRAGRSPKVDGRAGPMPFGSGRYAARPLTVIQEAP